MLLARSSRSNANVQALLVSRTTRRWIGQLQSRSTATVYKKPPKIERRAPGWKAKASMELKTDIAEKLFATGLTRTHGKWNEGGKRPRLPITADRTRTNLVDERLCDDIFAYYGHTLRDRHRGCDILDLFPGVGVWSRKLNDLLQPRSHILLEPDAKIYQPFLEPLLERPGTTLLAKSGIEWEHLNDILSPETLPHQTEQVTSYPPKRNDTLLITANLSWSPKKKFHDFPSVALLVLYQFIKSIQKSNQFQSYGLVRMLIWMTDEEKSHIIPRCVQSRRRLAVDADLACEWIVEVAGFEKDPFMRNVRDDHADIQSVQRTIERMRDQGIAMPPGRETSLYLANVDRKDKVVAGQQPATFTTPGSKNFDGLQDTVTQSSTAEERRRFSVLKGYYKRKGITFEIIHELLKEKDALVDEFMAAGADEEKLAALRERQDLFNEKLDHQPLHIRKALRPMFDNMLALRQDPPLLRWDRRPLEPLQVKPEEFLPNVPCALIDIQPKAVSPLLWRSGVDHENRAPDMADLLLRHLLSSYSASPVMENLQRIHPGADQDIGPNAPSLRDPRLGGSPLEGWGAVVGRCLNERQINELVGAWVDSPFSPDFRELVRTTYADEDSEYSTGNTVGRVSVKNL